MEVNACYADKSTILVLTSLNVSASRVSFCFCGTASLTEAVLNPNKVCDIANCSVLEPFVFTQTFNKFLKSILGMCEPPYFFSNGFLDAESYRTKCGQIFSWYIIQ